MPHLVIASKNPVKINSVLLAFQKMFPNETITHEGVSVPSHVSDQPMSDSETFTGAVNRATNAATAHPHGDYWVGIEGGIEKKDNEMGVFAWVIVKSKEGKIGKGKTGTFILPPKAVPLIEKGMELGDVDDMLFGRTNSKQQNGAIGILTDNAVDRTQLYVPAVIFALIPFKQKELYPHPAAGASHH